jgi:hypothetical protein
MEDGERPGRDAHPGYTVFTPEKEERFIKLLESGHTAARAATMCRIHRRTAYLHREVNAWFRGAWDEAVKIRTEVLEEEAFRRAVKGVQEPVYHLGNVTGTVRKYSDTLLIFLLKASDPGRYRDNMRIEHTGAEGGPMEVKVDDARGKLIARFAAIAARREEGSISDEPE